jgi:probable rRNA maturation factor
MSRSPAQQAPLDLSLQLKDAWAGPEHLQILRRDWVKKCVTHALEQNRGLSQLTLRLVGTTEGRQLNRQFRGQNHATNVLTFNYGGGCADLVLCAPVVAREARAQGKTLKAHYAHLLIHGTLHAQGYEHDSSVSAAEAMETLEAWLMLSLGFDNPYSG